LGDVAKKAQGNLQWRRRCWPPRGIGKPFSARVMGSAEYPARCGLWLPRRAAERDEKSNGTGSGTRTDQIPT
jgi:hypothetical protein